MKIYLKISFCLALLMTLSLQGRCDVYDWTGLANTDPNNTLNWYDETNPLNVLGVPGSGDDVQLGVHGLIVNVIKLIYNVSPVVTTPITWKTLTVAFNSYSGYENPNPVTGSNSNNALTTTLTVNGATLTILGNVTVEHYASAQGSATNFVNFTIAGTGTLAVSGNFVVGDATQPASQVAEVTQASLQAAQTTIAGNVVLNSTGNTNSSGSNSGLCYPWFSVEKGLTTIKGKIIGSAGTNSIIDAVYSRNPGSNAIFKGYGLLSSDYTGSISPTLELQNVAPITKADGFYVQMEAGGNSGSVVYDDNTATDVQTVYTANEPSVTTSKTYINTIVANAYYNLLLSGASFKAVDGNSTLSATTTAGLSVGGSWSNSWNSVVSGGVRLNTNNPTVTVAGNWANFAATTTMGTGKVAIGGSFSNAAGTITGSTASAIFTVGGTFTTTTGAINCNAENITVTGAATSTTPIVGGAGTLTFLNTFANTGTSGALTLGAGAATFTGNYSNTAGGIITLGSGNVYFGGNYTVTSAASKFTAGSGTVFFNGAAAQTLSDASSLGSAFNNVTVNSGKTCSMSVNSTGNFYVNPTYTLTVNNSSTLSVSNTTSTSGLTLLSNVTGDALVASLGNTGARTGTISGSVNVQRFITGGAGYRGYRLLSSPVNASSSTTGTGSINLAYINTNQTDFNATTVNGALTGGPSGSTNGFTVANNNPTIYLYKESNNTSNTTYVSGKNVGITAIAPASATVTTLSGTIPTANVSIYVGNGYMFYFLGNNASTIVTSSRTPENTTLTATGTLNQGSIPVKLWNTGLTALSYTTTTGAVIPGLNQVGNPYASTIALTQLYTDNYNATTNPISNVFYEILEPGQSYISYDAVNASHSSSTKASNYIVSGQGFFVTATSTAPGATNTLTFYEDQKVNIQQTASTSPPLLLALKPTQGYDAGLHLELSYDNDYNTQTGIYFSSLGSDVYNQQQDAIDLDGISPVVYLSSFSTDGIRLGINEMGDYIKGKRVKLFVKGITTGTYHLGMVDIKDIDTAVFNVFLVDKIKKDSVDLRKVKTYDFNITTTDTTSFGANRFELAVDLKKLAPYHLLSFLGEKTSTGALIKWTTSNESDYTGFTVEKLSGSKYIAIDSLQSDGSGAYSFTDTKLSKGVNTYRLKQNGVVGAISYSASINVIYDDTNVLSVFPNPAKGQVNINVNLQNDAYNLNIYNSMGGLVKHLSLTGNAWSEDISSFSTGTYILEVADKKGNFIGKTKVVKVQ